MMGVVKISGKKGSVFLQGQVLCHVQGSRGAVGQTQPLNSQVPRPEDKE